MYVDYKSSPHIFFQRRVQGRVKWVFALTFLNFFKGEVKGGK